MSRGPCMCQLFLAIWGKPHCASQRLAAARCECFLGSLGPSSLSEDIVLAPSFHFLEGDVTSECWNVRDCAWLVGEESKEMRMGFG